MILKIFKYIYYAYLYKLQNYYCFLQFLPSCNDDVVATGAADWNSHTYDVTTGKRLSVCTCARGRVKRIAVANDTPSVYWSASEDGCIRSVFFQSR